MTVTMAGRLFIPPVFSQLCDEARTHNMRVGLRTGPPIGPVDKRNAPLHRIEVGFAEVTVVSERVYSQNVAGLEIASSRALTKLKERTRK